MLHRLAVWSPYTQTGSVAPASLLNCIAMSCQTCCDAAAVLSGEAEELATAAVVHKSSAAAEAAYHIAATPFKVLTLPNVAHQLSLHLTTGVLTSMSEV